MPDLEEIPWQMNEIIKWHDTKLSILNNKKTE